MTVFCSNCGTPDNEGSKFCGNCGTALDQTQQANQSVPASPATVNYQAPVQQGYQEQWYPPQEGRPTGITVLAVLTGIGIAANTFSILGGSTDFLTLISYFLSIGVFYALWYMKSWGVKFIFGSQIFSAILSTISTFIYGPIVLRQTLAESGLEGSDLDAAVEFAMAFAQGVYIMGMLLTAVILWYVYSKRHLFVN